MHSRSLRLPGVLDTGGELAGMELPGGVAGKEKSFNGSRIFYCAVWTFSVSVSNTPVDLQ